MDDRANISCHTTPVRL